MSRKRVIVSAICIVCVVCALFSLTAMASSWYVYELSSVSGSIDRGHPREKTDYGNADVDPDESQTSYNKNYSNGVRYYLTQSSSDSIVGSMATGYTDRFDLNSFNISYRPAYACPGNYRMNMTRYSSNTATTVQVTGIWAP